MSTTPQTLPRRLESAWLPALRPSDARAARSRRELSLVNSVLANAGIVARELRAGLPARAVSIAALGAGDESFALKVARRLERPGSRMTLVDRCPRAPGLEEGFAAEGWELASIDEDASRWLQQPCTARFDAIFANFYLHRFAPDALAELLGRVSERTSLFIACEPRRSRTALAGSRLLGVVGCTEITQHDVAAGFQGGFCDDEIAALWSADSGWFLEERPAGLFSHVFVAEKA